MMGVCASFENGNAKRDRQYILPVTFFVFLCFYENA